MIPGLHKTRACVVAVSADLAVLAALKRLAAGLPLDLLATTDPEIALEWILDLDADLLVADEDGPTADLAARVAGASPRTPCFLLGPAGGAECGALRGILQELAGPGEAP